MGICHAGSEYVVTMFGLEIFRTDSKVELVKFVANVVHSWK